MHRAFAQPMRAARIIHSPRPNNIREAIGNIN
jgi:hypothetical protein